MVSTRNTGTGSKRISRREAIRIALAAQGFAGARRIGSRNRAHLDRVLDRTQLLQIDSVNVLTRAHYMPLYSRLGPYDPAPGRKRLGQAARLVRILGP